MFKVNQLACVRNGRVLFNNLDFALSPGEVLHIHGPNGVGKSSLLRVLCGLLEPAEGSIRWNGQLVDEDRCAFNADVGYLGHKLGLKSQLTVAENVNLFAQEMEQDQILQQLGMANLKNQRVETLSAGQQQRVALARLVARKTRLWLLDEPFTAIDKTGSAELEQIILAHVQTGGMVIFTSHQNVELHGINIRTIGL